MKTEYKNHSGVFEIKHLVKICFVGLVLGLTSCGSESPSSGSGSAASNNVTNDAAVQLVGVVVIPNLGVVQNATVTATDLITKKVVGTSSAKKSDGTYFIPTTTTNPVILRVTSGTYLDEYTGTNQSIPAGGISACIPTVSSATVAITPVTEIATQAALLRAKSNPTTSLATIIDKANKDVGSALLNGADPTTTIPIDISKATPANATQAQKNYARLLAGLASDAAVNSGSDLYTAAQNLTSALFDPYGAYIASTGTVPTAISNLQTAVKNYTPQGTIVATNVPVADPYAVIGAVNTIRQAVSGNSYYYLWIVMDDYSNVGQQVFSDVGYGIAAFNPNGSLVNNTDVSGYNNGVLYTLTNPKFQSSVLYSPYNQVVMKSLTGNLKGSTRVIEVSKDGEFGVSDSLMSDAANPNAMHAVSASLIVKKPTVNPTLASLKGVYHFILQTHDSSMAPTTAMPGNVEHGTITLDGLGALQFNLTKTVPTQGAPVVTTAAPTATYSIEPNGVVLLTTISGGITYNGHMMFSANGQYALYEFHGAGWQEWGIAIKDHKASIPFTAMTKGIQYDFHAQGLAVGQDFHKGLDVAVKKPSGVLTSNATVSAKYAFDPAILTPKVYCGPSPLTSCTGATFNRTHQEIYAPVAPNTTQAAVNGMFTMDPGGVLLTSYISQDGGVYWIDDGEAAAIVIGLGR